MSANNSKRNKKNQMPEHQFQHLRINIPKALMSVSVAHS